MKTPNRHIRHARGHEPLTMAEREARRAAILAKLAERSHGGGAGRAPNGPAGPTFHDAIVRAAARIERARSR